MTDINEIIDIIESLGGAASLDSIVGSYSNKHHVPKFPEYFTTIHGTLKSNPSVVQLDEEGYWTLAASNAIVDEKFFSYQEQLEKSGLNNTDNWKKDPRQRFITLLNPIVDNSAFSLKLNTTDTSAKILEVHHICHKGRIMGFSGRPNKDIVAFFNPAFYEELKKYIDLPENEKAYRSQPHITIDIKTVWDIFNIAVEKDLLS